MITDKKIEELYESTPDYVGVGFGIKSVNKEYTGEHVIVFTVEKKRPIKDIPKNELLPKEIEIDGIIYKTDVVEIGKVETFNCSTGVLDNCYKWSPGFIYNNVQYGDNIPPGNREFIRPLKGGISITSQNQLNKVGTLGFLAIDNEKNALVGVTNNHVVVGNAFYTALRNNSPVNEYQDSYYQPGEPGFQGNPTYIIGEVVRYVPIHADVYNQVDGALVTIDSSTISNKESFKQYGINYPDVIPFATTAEIDTLLSTNPILYSSGRTSGVKSGSLCSLTTFSLNQTLPINGYNLDGTVTPVVFNRVIGFTRTDSQCPFPIVPGDSGSALIANFNGVYKIIGLVFAGSTYFGFANRIDDVSSQLNISAWDGTTQNYFNTGSRTFITTPGGNYNKTLSCNNNIYWQVGTTNNNNSCN
jgi:hypothetical protein